MNRLVLVLRKVLVVAAIFTAFMSVSPASASTTSSSTVQVEHSTAVAQQDNNQLDENSNDLIKIAVFSAVILLGVGFIGAVIYTAVRRRRNDGDDDEIVDDSDGSDDTTPDTAGPTGPYGPTTPGI